MIELFFEFDFQPHLTNTEIYEFKNFFLQGVKDYEL